MSVITSVDPEIDPTQPPPPECLPDYQQLITEDDEPLDNFFSEKQQRLLTEPIYSAKLHTLLGRPILAAANVGLFFAARQPAIVPDVLLSLDVQLAEDLWPKAHRSYFIWGFGKPPDVVIEIVSNEKGGESERKRVRYAQLGIGYYLIFDPQECLHNGVLQCYELHGRTYVPRDPSLLPDVGLGLTLWQGVFEEQPAVWLRWCDQAGVIVPTGAERAEQEHQRAEQEHQRAEQERQRAERLAELLRALGLDPDTV